MSTYVDAGSQEGPSTQLLGISHYASRARGGRASLTRNDLFGHLNLCTSHLDTMSHHRTCITNKFQVGPDKLKVLM